MRVATRYSDNCEAGYEPEKNKSLLELVRVGEDFYSDIPNYIGVNELICRFGHVVYNCRF